MLAIAWGFLLVVGDGQEGSGKEAEGATKGRPELGEARSLLSVRCLWHIDAMPLTAGTHLGPYEILAPLGAGGMGEADGHVHLAIEGRPLSDMIAERLTGLPISHGR
jgi:hypothetical protein